MTRRLKSYSSAEEHVLAGDIIIEKKVKDEMLMRSSIRLNHRVHRLFAFASMFDSNREAPPQIIIDEEIKLILKSVDEIKQRMEVKRSIQK